MNKLLVVEDNKSMREMLQNILQEKGYEVKAKYRESGIPLKYKG